MVDWLPKRPRIVAPSVLNVLRTPKMKNVVQIMAEMDRKAEERRALEGEQRRERERKLSWIFQELNNPVVGLKYNHPLYPRAAHKQFQVLRFGNRLCDANHEDG